MIKSVALRNFQSHRDSQLEFSPGVNVIVGPTDAGKSSVVRALLWAFYNRPLGEEYRTRGSGETEVEVVLSSGASDVVIARIRGRSKNEYWRRGSEELKLTAFGQDPPEEILLAHNLEKELNVQTQIDPFFLLQSTPGEIARYFNQIAGLDEIDRLTKALAAHHRKVFQYITSTEERIVKLEEEHSAYDGLEQIGREIEQSEAFEVQIGEFRKTKAKLVDVLRSVSILEAKVETLRSRLRVKIPLDAALKFISEASDCQRSRDRLRMMLRRHSELFDGIESKRKILKASVPLGKALDLIRRVQEKHDRVATVGKLLTVAAWKERKICLGREKLKKLEEQFHRSMPDVCPLCGRFGGAGQRRNL